MKEETAKVIVDALKEAGINYVAYLPDSFFFEVLKLVEKDRDMISISVSNECTGLCMCAGAWLGGKKPVMIMENTGILVSAYGITRLHQPFGIPVLILTSYRGDVGDSWWMSIALGHAYEPILRALSIPYELVSNIKDAQKAIIKSQASAEVSEELRTVVFRGSGEW